jgi:hypothetical protein
MVITREETFGPVAPLYRFKTKGEAIKMANDTPTLTLPRSRGREGRGLASYFYSRNIGRIWRVAEALEYGIVGINRRHHFDQRPGEIAPFGGMKGSGIGPALYSLGLEIRHRGISRSQIPPHGRHRPVTHGGKRADQYRIGLTTKDQAASERKSRRPSPCSGGHER